MTGITEITRNGAKAARGLISVQSRLNQITDEGSSTGKKLTAWYKEHNIAIYDQEGQLKNLFEIAGEVSKIWDSLSKNEQMYYLNTQAGANQTQNLAALISNYDQVLYAHELALDSVGSAEQENARYMESLEAKINNFKAAFQELALTFINSDFVKQIIDLGTALLKFANTDLGQTIIKITAFGVALKSLSLIVGKLGLIESFTKLGKAIKSAFVFTTTTQNFSNLYGAFGKANQSANVLYGTTTKVTKGFGALAKNAKVALAAMSGFSKVTLALSAMYGIAKLFMYIAEKPSRDLEKVQSQLEENKTKMQEIDDEAQSLTEKQEKLAKQGKELADSEKERLEYLKKQSEYLEKQTLTEAERGVKAAYKAIGTVKDPYATGSTQYYQEEKAVQALINQYIELQRQYNNNKITQAEFINGADQLITRLTPLYNQFQQVIEAGGTLEGVDKGLYDSIEEIAAAFVNAGGKCNFYNSALATVSANNTVAKYVVEQFTDSLVEEGGTYKFVSEAAKAEVQNVLSLEAQKTKATLQQVNSRIAMRLAEYSSFAGLASTESGLRGRRNADGSYSYATKAEKEAAQLAQTYYKLKDAASAVSKMGVKTSSVTLSTTPSTKDDDSSSSSKKQEKENEKIKKLLDKLNQKYLESYQRRERIASNYYKKIQNKAWKYYKAGEIEYSTYQEYVKEAAKNIFEEIDYRYENGIYTADTYYTKITYFANKFYKKNAKFNKITYEEYREYMQKAVKATIENLKEQYEKGKLSAEDYYDKVKKLAGEAKDDKIISEDEYLEYAKEALEENIDTLDRQYEKGKLSGQQYCDKLIAMADEAKEAGIIDAKEYADYVEKAYNALLDSIANDYDRGRISAEKYYDLILTKGEQALKAGAISADEYADKLKEAADALKEVAQYKIDAFEFFAEEKKLQIDKLIDAEEARIDKLNEQLEAMQEQNDVLDAQAERMELINNLADAEKQKIRIFDESLGWVWVSDPRAISDAKKALEDFDTQKRREESEKAIQKEIENIEKVIANYEAQKQAYDDLIEEQSRVLERWEIENELGMTIEAAVLQGRLDNFANFKENYLAIIDEMIDAMEKWANAQTVADTAASGYSGYSYTPSTPKVLEGKTTTLGATYYYSEDASKQEKRNAAVSANIAQRQAEGYKVTTWTDASGNLSYKAESTATSKANVKAGTAEPLKNTKKKAIGSLSLPETDVYRINELGDELLVPPTGDLAYLSKGTGVIPAHLTSNLMDLGKYNMSQWARLIGGAMGGNTTDSHDIIIQNMTVKSDNANDFVRQLQNLSILKK